MECDEGFKELQKLSYLHGKNIMKSVENIDFGNSGMNQNVIYIKQLHT